MYTHTYTHTLQHTYAPSFSRMHTNNNKHFKMEADGGEGAEGGKNYAQELGR